MIRAVKRSSERRQHARFPQALEVIARSMSPVGSAFPTPREIRGRVQNLSEGGVCIMTSQALPVSSFVCCEISMPDIPVAIPALMQVRWTAKKGRDSHNHYMHGLNFIAR